VPMCRRAVLTRSRHPRSLPPATLASLAERASAAPLDTAPDARRALATARALAGPEGAVLVTGSLHLIADLVRDGSVRRASTL
jgi:dihydrofolate synthase / folylpolyglutamate synthase